MRSTGLIGATLALLLASGAAAPPLARGAPEASMEQARAEVQKARKAAARGRWKTALTHFSRAMEIRPSPKLHYNIAVCHHRLAIEAKASSAAAKKHTSEAIDAYNRYLEANPDATDGEEVAAAVRELGGTPVSSTGAVERVDLPKDGPRLNEKDYTDLWDAPAAPTLEPPPPVDAAREVAADEATDPETETETEAETEENADDEAPADDQAVPADQPTLPERPPKAEPRPPKQWTPRGRVGAAFTTAILHPVDTLRSSRVDIPLAGGLLLHGGGYLGKKKALTVGGEIGLAIGIPTQLDRHGLVFLHGGVTTDYSWILGKSRRVEIQAGGLLGVAFQALREREAPASPVTCPIGGDGESSRRGGLVAGLRPGVFVLLGKRRNHMVGLRVLPAVLIMSKGEKAKEDADGESCEGVPDPFREVGLEGGFGFGLLSDLGYTARF